MAQLSYPLDDTLYTAADAQIWHSTRTQGVYSSNSDLILTPTTAMTINLSPGIAWMKYNRFTNAVYANTTDLQFTLDTADGILTRLDRLVVRWDNVTNTITAQIKKGTATVNPIAPALQRDAEAYEIGLFDIRVRPGALQITAADIIDLRLNETLCGVMRDGVTGLPTQSLYDAWWAWFNALKTSAEGKVEDSLSDWLAYISNLKVQSNKQYQVFLLFLADLKSQSNEEYQLFLTYIQSLRDSADQTYISFIDWLNQYRISAQQEFEDWFESIKDILDENAAGNLLLLIEELQDLEPTAKLGTIIHTLEKYPVCQLFKTKWAAGIGGAGLGAGGGENLVKVKGGFELSELDKITLTAPKEFKNCTDIHKINENQFAFVDVQSDIETTSLLLVIY